tara:strand:+ start:2810 stop:4366 length:1557 start_codon:yes stop_codon:yes gene_type:complete
MAIIRSKIARQLLAEGGAPRVPFRSGGQGRTDANTMTGSGYTSSFDDGFGGGDEFARPTYSEQYAAMNVPDAVSTGGDNEPSFFQKAKNRFKTFETDARMNRVGRGLLTDFGAIKSAVGLRDVPPELLGTLADDYTQGGLFSEGLVGGDISLENAARTFQGLEDLGVDLTGDIRSQVAGISTSKFADRFGPKTPKTEGGDNEAIIKRLRAPIAEKTEEPKGEFDDVLKFYGAKFEDGGEVRQNYGLGSIVKKATRAVKKVVKSPLGKAALLGGLAYFGPSFLAGTKFGFAGTQGPLALQRSMKAARLGRAFGEFAGGLNPLTTILGTSAIAGLASKKDEEDEKLPTVEQSDPEFQKYLAFYGGPRRFAESGGDIEDAPIKMASAPAPAAEMNDALEDLARKYFKKPLKDLTPDQIIELENVIEEMSKKQGIERTMAAGGGMMNPNDEMLDLGGNEMDLRGGGFVPLGEYEKKDDVPARLSKNEFVFTADAVKAAGGGSVDKGADVMYKTMKTLENKVA